MMQSELEQSLSKPSEPFRRDRITSFPTPSRSLAFWKNERHATEDTGYTLLENAGIGVYGLDLDGFVTFVNPAARRMTGWTLEDLRGRTQHSMVHHSHADGRNYPREECPIYMAFHDGRTHCREDEVFWRKDGTSFPVEYTSTPVFTEGVLTGAVVVFSDISDRIRRRNWDRARIDILKGILQGRGLDDTANALCDAFGAFQRGDTLSIHVSGHGKTEDLTFAEDASPDTILRQLTIRSAAGMTLAKLTVHHQPRSSETIELAEALVELGSLLESALVRRL